MEKMIVVSEPTKDILQSVKKREEQGIKLLEITEEHSPQKMVRMLYDYINHLSVDNLSEKEIEDYAYNLGAVWSLILEKEYAWSWKYFKHKEDNLSNIYMVSPQNFFCNSPMSFIYENLVGNKKDAKGNKDNTILLMFNAMDNIDATPDNRKYVLLA